MPILTCHENQIDIPEFTFTIAYEYPFQLHQR